MITIPTIPTIPVETAVRWVDRWRCSKDKTVDLKGFFVPKQDLSGILTENVLGCREYLAIDDSGQLHLLIVGVDSEGNDLVDPKKGEYVYDFTRPCPPMCSKTGPFK